MQFITSGDRIAVENFSLGDLYTITFTSGTYINSACIGIGENFVSFQRNEPELLFTLNMETAELVSSIDLYAGGTGTNNYNDLTNKPQIGGVELVGNKTLAQLGIQSEITAESPLSSSLVSGLGSAAAAESSDFATAAQGALAASAIQSAGTGLTKSGTTLNHSNSVSAKTSESFASITYDAQGHITGSTAATTAQLDAINSGITSTDVAQIETNKNNILYNQLMGVKNMAKPYGTSDTNNNVTYTYNADGTISVKSDSATHNQSTKRVATFTAPYAGKFYINGIPEGASNTTFFLNITGSGGVNRNIVGDDEVNPTTAGYVYNINIYVRANVEVDTTFSIMFRPDSISDSTYQPYSPSNRELYEMILALQ